MKERWMFKMISCYELPIFNRQFVNFQCFYKVKEEIWRLLKIPLPELWSQTIV